MYLYVYVFIAEEILQLKLWKSDAQLVGFVFAYASEEIH